MRRYKSQVFLPLTLNNYLYSINEYKHDNNTISFRTSMRKKWPVKLQIRYYIWPVGTFKCVGGGSLDLGILTFKPD